MTTAVTGSLVIADRPTASFPAKPSDAILFVSGVVNGSPKAVFGGDTVTSGSASILSDLTISGLSNIRTTSEVMFVTASTPATVSFALNSQSVFYISGPTADVTSNFTGVPTTSNRVLTPTIIVSQSATPRIVSAVQIDSSPQTIRWSNNVTPTGTANKYEVFGFSLIRSGSTWIVLGQLSSYG
jgi:hypothetical protein